LVDVFRRRGIYVHPADRVTLYRRWKCRHDLFVVRTTLLQPASAKT
jgi:hypothetical protein